jgi:predicted O-methyltransferase YrrM
LAKGPRIAVEMTVPWNGKSNRRYYLDWLIKEHDIKVIAEVGVRDGRTTFYLLDQNPNLIIYAIDKSISEFYNNEIKQRYGNRLIPIEALSTDGAKRILDNSLDLVFIDADHSYDWVKKDIAAYKPKLKKGGWLTGHDIDFPGVNRAVNEVIVKYDVGPNNVWLTIT